MRFSDPIGVKDIRNMLWQSMNRILGKEFVGFNC